MGTIQLIRGIKAKQSERKMQNKKQRIHT